MVLNSSTQISIRTIQILLNIITNLIRCPLKILLVVLLQKLPSYKAIKLHVKIWLKSSTNDHTWYCFLELLICSAKMIYIIIYFPSPITKKKSSLIFPEKSERIIRYYVHQSQAHYKLQTKSIWFILHFLRLESEILSTITQTDFITLPAFIYLIRYSLQRRMCTRGMYSE